MVFMALKAGPDDPGHEFLRHAVEAAGGKISFLELNARFERQFGVKPNWLYKNLRTEKEWYRLELDSRSFRIKSLKVYLRSYRI